jgi:hypothetical protein
MDSTGSNSKAPGADQAADVAIGLATYNQAGTIGGVIQSVCQRIEASKAGARAVVLVADSGSTDGTVEAARRAGGDAVVEAETPRHSPLSRMPYHGSPGRAGALQALLEGASARGARACVVIDASLRSHAPEHVDRLLAPVLKDEVDYVTPYYTRHPLDGPITTAIVAPAFRALYGVGIRQPAASEFGCSMRFARHLLEQEWWDREGAQVGVDLWLAAAAVCDGFRICEAPLGIRDAAPSGAPPDLSTALAQVVGALFADLEERVDDWQRVRETDAAQVCGDTPPGESPAPQVNVERLADAFQLGYRELRDIWTWVLPPRTLVELRRMAAAPLAEFRFDDQLWASIVYDFAFGYAFRVMARDHLLGSLAPLYAGWMTSFLVQSAGDPARAAARLDEVTAAFEAQKRYLISRWRWPEKLRR